MHIKQLQICKLINYKLGHLKLVIANSGFLGIKIKIVTEMKL